MTYTKDYADQEQFLQNIYFTMFVSDLANLSEKYRIYLYFSHEYTKCFTGERGLWEE